MRLPVTVLMANMALGCAQNPCVDGEPLRQWPGPWQGLQLPIEPGGAICAGDEHSLQVLTRGESVTSLAKRWQAWADENRWRVEPRLENTREHERVVTHYLHGTDAMTRVEIEGWVGGTTQALLLRRDALRPPDLAAMHTVEARLDRLRRAAAHFAKPALRTCDAGLNERSAHQEPLLLDKLELAALRTGSAGLPDVTLISSLTSIEALYPENRGSRAAWPAQRALLAELAERDILVLVVVTERTEAQLGLEAEIELVGREYVGLKRGRVAGWVAVWDERAGVFACQAPFAATSGQFGTMAGVSGPDSVRRDLRAQGVRAARLALQQILPDAPAPTLPEKSP